MKPFSVPLFPSKKFHETATNALRIYSILLLGFLILILLPNGISYLLWRSLIKSDIEEARVGNVDFNPFTGVVVIDELEGKVGENRKLYVQQATLNFAWGPI
jgi:hypothetical protein